MNFAEIVQPRLTVYGLGQVGVVLSAQRKGGEFLVIDPYLTSSIEQNNPGTEFVRAFAPPFAPEQLQGAVGVLITHHHDDHLDQPTLGRLADVSPNTQFAAPAPHWQLMEAAGVNAEKRLDARVGERFTMGSFAITPVGAAHTSYEFDEYGDHVYLGYLIEVDGLRVYHAGDTVLTDELLETVRDFQPHVAFLPVNGSDYVRSARNIVGNMNYREALDLTVLAGIELVFPMHLDLFPNNRENPSYFTDYLYARYPGQHFHMLMAGEQYVLA